MGLTTGLVTGAAALFGAVNAHQQASAQADALKQQQADAATALANKPQAAQAPGAAAVAAGQAGTGQANGAPGAASTFLTGAAGVDPSTLNLGKSTLLGG